MKIKFLRVISMLLVVVMLLSSLPLSVLATDTDNSISNENISTNTNETVAATDPALGSELNAPPAGTETNYPDYEYDEDVNINVAGPMNYSDINVTGDLTIYFSGDAPIVNVTGNITVSGDLTIEGVGTLNINGKVTAGGNIRITQTAVTMYDARSTMTANGDSITLAGAKVSHVGFLGFDASATGLKTISIENFNGFTTLVMVQKLGAADNSTATVVMSSTSVDPGTDSSGYCIITDTPVTYYGIGGEELTPAADWMISYRVNKTVDANKVSTNSFVGYHTPSEFVSDADGELALPAYTVVGYVDNGWGYTADATKGYKLLSIANIGKNAFYAKQNAKNVTVSFDRGYDPTQFTNDNASTLAKVYEKGASVGDELPADIPTRMGYTFAGWYIRSGSDPRVIAKEAISSYRIAVSDMTENGVDSYLLSLEAVWEAKEYPVSITIIPPSDSGNVTTLDDMRIECDCTSCNGNAQTISEFVSAHSEYILTSSGGTITFKALATYGSTLSEYFEKAGVPGFSLKDNTGGSFHLNWETNDNHISASNDVRFEYGNGGFYGDTLPTGYTTLAEYEEYLGQTSKLFVPTWGSFKTDITFSDKTQWYNASNELWTILVNGVDRTADVTAVSGGKNAVLSDVLVGSQISFRVPVSQTAANAAFSLWSIYDSNHTRIPVSESKEGGYRLYTFTMPEGSVTATLASTAADVVFNMKTSPVSEQKIGDVYGVWTNELIANLTPRYDRTGAGLGYAPNSELNGIDLADGWCNGTVAFGEMNYFYELPLAKYYYLTTNDANIDQTSTIDQGNGTWNQWRGGQRTVVYLQDCHLWATSEYSKIDLQTQIPSADERTFFNDGRMPKISNLYMYLTDGVQPSTGCYIQYFVGNNNIIGCIGTEGYAQQSTASAGGAATEIRIGARIANGSPLGQWLTPAGSFYPYAHTEYQDNFGYWTFGANYAHGWANVNLYLPHKLLSSLQAYNISGGFIHVRAINMLNIRSNCTMILEESVTEQYGFEGVESGSVAIVRGDFLKSNQTLHVTNGTFLVLGDVMRTQTLTMDNQSTVIANTIEVQALDAKGTILANRIRNHSVGSSSNQATANGDSGYTMGVNNGSYVDNTNDAKILYRLLSGNLYLLGYDAADASNPLRKYAEELPAQTYDENGYPILISPTEFTAVINGFKSGVATEAVDMYEAAKGVNGAVECFELGNSAKDDRRFQLGGANIYSAGCITMNNTANISGGIIRASALSSKWDLLISGGDIEAKEIGNAAAVKIAKANGSDRYAKTEITGGNIKADRIGALSASVASENRSSLTVLSPNTLAPYTEGEDIRLVHDAWVSHRIDTSKFAAPEASDFAIRISCTYNAAKALTAQEWLMEQPSAAGSFAQLAYADSYAGSGEAKWSISDTEGIFVTGYDKNGNLLNGSTVMVSVAWADGITLYAIEVSQQKLLIEFDSGVVSGMTAGGTAVDFSSGSLDILSGSAVEVTIDPAMKNKVLFFYQDESMVLHNLFPTVSEDGTKVTLTMPFRDCELYITSSFELYLNRYDISFPAGNTPGFRTEATAVNADRAFDYAGDVRVTRDDGKYTSDITTYKLWLDDGFDNRTWPGKLILNGIRTHFQPIDRINAVMYVDGSARFLNTYNSATRLRINGTLTLQGYNGNRQDSFNCVQYCFGGMTESLSFVDLSMPISQVSYHHSGDTFDEINFIRCDITSSTHLIHSSASVNNVVNFEDCHITLTGNSAGIANATLTLNMTNCTVEGKQGTFFKGNLMLDNTQFTTPAAPTEAQLNREASSFTNIELKNGSVFDTVVAFMATNVTVSSGSKLFAGYDPETQEGLGRFAALNITVEGTGSELNAKYVICSGYVWSSSPSGHHNSGINQQGIVVKDGGKIYASEFIGGDNNGKITVSDDGHIESRKIGLYGGYFQMWALSGSYPIIFSTTTRETSVVTIKDGGSATVLPGGYIGGGKSTVTVEDGGTVNLEPGAILGSSQGTVAISGTVLAETGSIIGKTVTISGATAAVKAANIEADVLNVDGFTIQSSQTTHTNPYAATNKTHDYVAVWITEKLYAREITIQNGAVVYAEIAEAYANTGETGRFEVDNKGSALYTNSFGTSGTGTVETFYVLTENGDLSQNIWGLSLITIHYDMGIGSDVDDPITLFPTINFYSYGQDEGSLALETPERGTYYIFSGWRDENGHIITSLNTYATVTNNAVTLTAVWVPVEIEVSIAIPDADKMSPDEFTKLISTEMGAMQGTSFVFTEKLTIPYKDIILGENGYLKLNNYVTESYVFNMVQWNATILSESSVITKAMVDEARAGGLTFVLSVPTATYRDIIFDLNINGRPGNAIFGYADAGASHSYTLKLRNGSPFNATDAAKAFYEAQAKALGYTFIGWSLDPNATSSTFDPNAVVGVNMDGIWYAVWEVNTYDVTFNAAKPDATGTYYVTTSGEPQGGEASEVTVSVAFDELFTSPLAWKEGGVFLNWFYIDGDGKQVSIDVTQMFNQENFGMLSFETGESITFYADFRNVRVNYHLNGGVWTTKEEAGYVEYDHSGLPLKGYTENGVIIRTTADYYKTYGTYQEGDYREDLSCHGYTFIGWEDENGTPVTGSPRFNDAEYYAQWQANTYNVTLWSSDPTKIYEQNEAFVKLDSANQNAGNNAGESTTVVMTVGETFNGGPDRSEWGVWPTGATEARPMWGFVYMALDPMVNTPRPYDDIIQSLYGFDQLYVKDEGGNGTVFTLPDQTLLENALGSDAMAQYNLNFADLPAGSEIVLYAVYREYAMMFVQYYLDADGNPTKEMVKTVNYSDLAGVNSYPAPTLTEIPNGYSLVDWYINTTEFELDKRYDATESIKKENLDAYKAEAKTKNIYDVIVYAILAASSEIPGKSVTADATAQSTNTLVAKRVTSFTIPASMRPGTLFYTISDIKNGLNLVSKDSLALYATAQTGGNANNTAALTLTITSSGEEHTLDLGLGENIELGNIQVKPGDTLTLTLYHTYVMSADKYYSMDITFGFKHGSDVITGQKLTLSDFGVYLVPSQYNVTYNSGVADISFATGDKAIYLPTGNSTFSESVIEYTQTVTLNMLFDPAYVMLPGIEGYRNIMENGYEVWRIDGGGTMKLSADGLMIENLPENNSGSFTLTAGWEIIKYLFTLDSALADKWTVTGATSGEEVAYNTVIKFTAKGEQQAAFVAFALSDGRSWRLDLDTTSESGTYAFKMPASALNAMYKDIVDLYLQDGNITITETAYTVGSHTVIWPGHYKILTNASDDFVATTNTIDLSGDLTARNIYLGNINITSKDSIHIQDNTNVVLTLMSQSTVCRLKNMLVGESATLRVDGNSGTMEFSPDSGVAAIGNRLGGSNAEIAIENAALNVNEPSGYIGVWFGGNLIGTVSLSNVSVMSDTSLVSGGRYIVSAGVVNIQGSTLGSEASPLTAPIYAENELAIRQSEIYLSINTPLLSVAPIGTGENGSIDIDESVDTGFSIISITYGADGSSWNYYTGTMNIFRPESTVIINGNMLLEVGHGDIIINSDGATQGSVTKPHTGGYWILEEQLSQGSTPNLTVNGLNGNITLDGQQFVIGTLHINVDAPIESLGNLMLSAINIADSKELKLTMHAGYRVNLAQDAFKDSLGTYAQSNGELTSTYEIVGENTNISLNGVSVDAVALKAKNLSLNNSIVLCTGDVGSIGKIDEVTTVTLSGQTSINAATIGALGTQDSTFIKVIVDGTNVTVTGTLQRDVMKITYEVPKGYTLSDTAHTVLRIVEVLADETITNTPNGAYVLSNPTVEAGKKDRFLTWYILDGTNKIALTASIDEKYQSKFSSMQNGLSAEDLKYASNDEIPMITVYGFISISGTVALTEDKVFEKFNDGANTLSIFSDRAWSALFTIESTREQGEDYAIMLDKALPIGTKLTLVWLDRTTGKPMYYYYTVSADHVTEILFSQFIAMGSNNITLNLGASDKESEDFILIVDHSGVEVVPDTYKIGFGYKSDSSSDVDELCFAQVTVTAANENAAVTESNNSVSVTLPENELYSGKVYAILVEANEDFRYDLTPVIGDIEGKLIGGNMVLFVIGNYNEISDTQKELGVSNLPTGLKWTLVLLENIEQVNTWKRFSE